MSKFQSRFITENDKATDYMVYPIPSDWWSRFYEYQWAGEFAEPGDIALDAACGIGHHFKFYLSEICKEVHAFDLNDTIKDTDLIIEDIRKGHGEEVATKLIQAGHFDKIQFAHADMTKVPYENKKFDKIYCISVLEHIGHEGMLKSLEEFKRILKDDGLIVLTFDYPLINLDNLQDCLDKLGLKFANDHSFELPESAIFSDTWGDRWCYRAVLMKKED